MIKFITPREPLSANPAESIMDVLLNAQIPIASSCGGEGVCLKCKIQIINGAENLSPKTEVEKLAELKGVLKPNERLSCQTQHIKNDATIHTSYW